MRMPAICQQSAVSAGLAIDISAFHPCPTLLSRLFDHYFLLPQDFFKIWKGVGMIEASRICPCAIFDTACWS